MIGFISFLYLISELKTIDKPKDELPISRKISYENLPYEALRRSKTVHIPKQPMMSLNDIIDSQLGYIENGKILSIDVTENEKPI